MVTDRSVDGGKGVNPRPQSAQNFTDCSAIDSFFLLKPSLSGKTAKTGNLTFDFLLFDLTFFSIYFVIRKRIINLHKTWVFSLYMYIVRIIIRVHVHIMIIMIYLLIYFGSWLFPGNPLKWKISCRYFMSAKRTK